MKPKIANLPDPQKINWDELKKKIALDEKWHKIKGEWDRKHGWKDTRRGTCRLCGSKVRPDEHKEVIHDGHIRIGGPPLPTRIVRNGFYCTNDECGIMYKTCPPPITEEYDVPPPVRGPEE